MTLAVRPIFLDVEVFGWNSENKEEIPDIRELAAYDPTRPDGKNRFSAFVLKPEDIARGTTPAKVDDAFRNANVGLILKEFTNFCVSEKSPEQRVVLISHNMYGWDKKVLKQAFEKSGLDFPKEYRLFDTLAMANLASASKDKSLQGLRAFYQIPYNVAHRAVEDVDTVFKVFAAIVGKAKHVDVYNKMLDEHPIKAVTTAIRLHRAVIPFFYDTETTGLLLKEGETGDQPSIVELSAYTPSRVGEAARFSALINPGKPIPQEAQNVHHISDEQVKNAETFKKVYKRFLNWMYNDGDPDATRVMFAHNNYGYDLKVMKIECDRIGKKFPADIKQFDTLFLSRCLHKGEKGFSHKLQNLRVHYGIAENEAHRASADVEIMFQVWEKMCGKAPVKEVLRATLDPHPIKAVEAVIRRYNTDEPSETRGVKRSAEGLAKGTPNAKHRKIEEIDDMEV